MVRTLWTLAMVMALAAGCSDDESVPPTPIDARIVDAAIDAPVDAAIDAPLTGCAADGLLTLTGEYIDWDSTIAAFDGVENARWTVVSPAGGRVANGAPNGRIILCIDPTATSQIDLIQTAPGEYLPGRFVADPAVFAPAGATFSIRGLKTAMTAAQFTEFGVTYDASAAQVLVYKLGAPVPLALAPATTPAQRSFVSDGDDDVTWTEGTTGTLTLFPNRPVGGGTATLTSTSTFIGPTTLPLAAGRVTFVVVR